MDTENVLYSYDWQGDLVEGVYEAKGVEVNNAAPLVVLAIKRQIAAKLYEDCNVILFEPEENEQKTGQKDQQLFKHPQGKQHIQFGQGPFHFGDKVGQIDVHVSYGGGHNFTLDVYEAGEPRKLVSES
ncbi:hypothetical protein N5F07_13550 [Pseudomonas chengduensis]|nr:hypothetical protein [Pseudomonas chengduensis]MDH1622192.1 hypothetical protein [Pseudomonas chengduensis]